MQPLSRDVAIRDKGGIGRHSSQPEIGSSRELSKQEPRNMSQLYNQNKKRRKGSGGIDSDDQSQISIQGSKQNLLKVKKRDKEGYQSE